MTTTTPKYTYKDLDTGKIRWTRGRFVGWQKLGLLGARYAIFRLRSGELFVPRYLLTPETKAALDAHERS